MRKSYLTRHNFLYISSLFTSPHEHIHIQHQGIDWMRRCRAEQSWVLHRQILSSLILQPPAALTDIPLLLHLVWCSLRLRVVWQGLLSLSTPWSDAHNAFRCSKDHNPQLTVFNFRHFLSPCVCTAILIPHLSENGQYFYISLIIWN